MNMQNKKLNLGVLLALALLLATTSKAQVSGALSLANLAVEPNPAKAGENVTITFQLYNSYDNSLKNIDMQLQGAYPLLNFSPSGTYEISTLGEGLSFGFYTYILYIPKTTPEGVYTLNVVATYETSPPIGIGEEVGSSVLPITIYVYNQPNITINLLPSEINPGEDFGASLIVANNGEGTARNVRITLLNSSNISVVGAKELNIGALEMGQQIEEEASYHASRNINSGSHTLHFIVNYTTDTNSSISKEVNLTIEVNVKVPEVKVSAINGVPAPLYTGYNQTLTLQVTNTGSGIAKNVTVSINSGNGAEVLSSSRTFFFG
ncbi:COG1361 S-layer family protein, partial [Caldivirga sp.]|uniref:COG1361 S-layer family protein n=1 Tax=Caldivirga sp. TaxID=2080243 RepID=UPI00345C34B3